MKTDVVETLNINPSQEIKVLIPTYEEKINYFYQPSKGLHQFDEVRVIYKDRKYELILHKDALQSVLDCLYTPMKMLLKGMLEVPEDLKGCVGLQWVKDELTSRVSEETKKAKELLIGVEYLVWTYKQETQTVMYRINDKYYLEISPQYEWLFGPLVKEDDEDIDEEPEGFYSFEEYEKKYKPLVVAELSKETLLDWKKKCENIFDKVGIRSLFK